MAVTKTQAKAASTTSASSKKEKVPTKKVAKTPAAEPKSNDEAKKAVTDVTKKAVKDMYKRNAVLETIYAGLLTNLKDAMKNVSHKKLVETCREKCGMAMTSNRVQNYTRMCDAYTAITGAPETAKALMALKGDELRMICREAHLKGFSNQRKLVMTNMILKARKAIQEFVNNKPDDPEESEEADLGDDSDEEVTGPYTGSDDEESDNEN